MSQFWVLTEPNTDDAERRLVEWSEDEPLKYRIVTCSLKPDGHRGARERISTPYRAALPNLEPQDILWTRLGECFVQKHVLDVFEDAGLTGYQAIPAIVKFKNGNEVPPQLWELAITGSAGSGSPESGLRLLHKCPGCDLTDYSQVTHPEYFVDESQWDGSDFFRVSPVEGWIFVTNKVREVLRTSAFTGWEIKSLPDMQQTFDIALPDGS